MYALYAPVSLLDHFKIMCPLIMCIKHICKSIKILNAKEGSFHTKSQKPL